jgi:hypothetical protein
MSGDRSNKPAGEQDTSSGDLDRAFALLKTIRAYKNSRFPFLRTRVDYDLLLYIGHGQVGGKPMNLTDILTSNIGTVSTIVRRLGRLEKLGVVHKVKATSDKRNVHYFLAEAHLEAVAEFVTYLHRAGSSDDTSAWAPGTSL